MDSWAAEELAQANLGDARLHRRLIQVVEALAAHPTASVPAALGHAPAQVKATYRLWENPRVHAAAMRAAHRKATRARALAAGMVLLVQDTTSLDFTSHKAMRGLGMLDHPQTRGVFVHSTLAVSLEGVPLGLVAQAVWTRDPASRGKGAARNGLPTVAKESARWLTALAASQRALPASVPTVTIADREAEMYDLWTAPRRPTDHVLVRARHNRKLATGSATLRVREQLQQEPVALTMRIQVPRQHAGATTQPAREATVTLRYATVTVAVPRLKTGEPVALQAIQVTEVGGDATGTEPIDWLLYTTLPISSAAVARLYVEWYLLRWRIERFHYVLKSGCGIELAQVRTVERLDRVLAVYSIVAWRLMALLYGARQAPAVSCETLLAPDEWAVLWGATHPPGMPLPPQPPTIQEAVHLMARLGGHLGRRGDGEPGIKALWRGWARLSDMLIGYRTYQQLTTRLMGNA